MRSELVVDALRQALVVRPANDAIFHSDRGSQYGSAAFRKVLATAGLRQDTETFLRVLENAIRSFGGAPLTLNVDNLKAAVTKADWYDPQITEVRQTPRFYPTTDAGGSPALFLAGASSYGRAVVLQVLQRGVHFPDHPRIRSMQRQ